MQNLALLETLITKYYFTLYHIGIYCSFNNLVVVMSVLHDAGLIGAIYLLLTFFQIPNAKVTNMLNVYDIHEGNWTSRFNQTINQVLNKVGFKNKTGGKAEGVFEYNTIAIVNIKDEGSQMLQIAIQDHEVK